MTTERFLLQPQLDILGGLRVDVVGLIQRRYVRSRAHGDYVQGFLVAIPRRTGQKVMREIR